MQTTAAKFEIFEWLQVGTGPVQPQFEPKVRSTNSQSLNAQDRLGVSAMIPSDFGKAVLAIILWGEKAQQDYHFVQRHLAMIMISNANRDGKRGPRSISLQQLAVAIAKMVIEFSLHPEYEQYYTEAGRLAFAGIQAHQMNSEAYRKTWLYYENLMALALEMAIQEAAETVQSYRKQCFKDAKDTSSEKKLNSVLTSLRN